MLSKNMKIKYNHKSATAVNQKLFLTTLIHARSFVINITLLLKLKTVYNLTKQV